MLFSIVALPIHVWALILIFRDLSWVAERTNMWDAIGVGAYGLVLALLESFLVFFVASLAGFLVSTKWDETRRIALIGTLVTIVSIWAILGQLYFLLEYSLPVNLIQALASTARPLRILYGIVFMIVTPTVLLPTYAQLRSIRLNQLSLAIFDRLSLLVVLYLIMDLISIAVIFIRNL